MKHDKRGTLIAAFFLIGLGFLFLALNLVLGWSNSASWPVIFFVISAGCIVPALAFPTLRRGLAALFIPGMVLLMLGVIFTYNVLSQDWNVWAYAWLLLSSGAGAGIALAAWYGGWGRTVSLTGMWIMLGTGAVFAFFGFIFGSALLKTITAILLILFGLLLLLRSLFKK